MENFKQQLMKKINEGKKEYKNIYDFTKDVKEMHVKVNRLFSNFFDSGTGLTGEDLKEVDKICQTIERNFSMLRKELLELDSRKDMQKFEG